MKKFVLKIVNLILRFQENKYKKKLETKIASSSRGIKTQLSKDDTVILKNTVLDNMCEKLTEFVTPLIKNNIENPNNLLNYVKDNGTKVYKINNADKILALIGEVEGFITPLKGLRALYLNLILEKKISFSTQEMFIVRDLPLNIYFMAHQFYKWYGFKIEMPGYDATTQEKFKHIWEFENAANVLKLDYSELVNLKEAIDRDIEAIDFVIKLAKESEGARQGFQNIKNDGEANI